MKSVFLAAILLCVSSIVQARAPAAVSRVALRQALVTGKAVLPLLMARNMHLGVIFKQLDAALLIAMTQDIQEPIDLKQDIYEPIDLKQDIYEPIDLKKDIQEPIDLKQDIYEPIDLKKDIQEPIVHGINGWGAADLPKDSGDTIMGDYYSESIGKRPIGKRPIGKRPIGKQDIY